MTSLHGLAVRIRDAGGPVRAVVICLLCAATVALLAGDIRYQTKRSGLFPAIATGKWGVSPSGVSVLNADPSVVILAAKPGTRFPYVVNQIARPQGLDRIRVRAEAAAHGVRPGRNPWQTARILFWSYDENAKRMRYLPHELGALHGTTDWTSMSLVVPVLPETRLLRFIIYNGGQSGRMFVRNITVDEVTETRLFRALKAAFVALWVAVPLWAVWPLARIGFRRPLAGLTLLAGICVIGGTLAPQPLLSDTLQPVIAVAQRMAGPLWPAKGPETQGAAPSASTAPSGADDRPAAAPIEADPDGEQSVAGERMTFTPDWAPRLEAGVAAHMAAFVLLGLMMCLAFPAVPVTRIFLYLLVFSISIETVQGFYVTRTPEARDLAGNVIGTLVGFALAAIAVRAMRRRRAPG